MTVEETAVDTCLACMRDGRTGRGDIGFPITWAHNDELIDHAFVPARLRTALERLVEGIFWADGDRLRCGVCGQWESGGHDENMVCAAAVEALSRIPASDKAVEEAP